MPRLPFSWWPVKKPPMNPWSSAMPVAARAACAQWTALMSSKAHGLESFSSDVGVKKYRGFFR